MRRENQKEWAVNLSTGDGFTVRLWGSGFGIDEPAHTGDLNGDGKTDIFVWNQTLKVWVVNLSDGNDFNQSLWPGAWGSDGTIFTGDLNGDGKTDAFMRESATQWTVNISSGADFSSDRWNGDLGSGDALVTGDLTGDKKTEVLLWDATKGIWAVDVSTGSGFARQDWTGTFVGGVPILTGDVDGDSKMDLVMWKDADKTWSLNLSSFIIKGKLVCLAPNGNSPTKIQSNIPSAKVSIANSYAFSTKADGTFEMLWFDQPTNFSLRLYYEGDVGDNNPVGVTPLQIMDDGHNTRSDVRSPAPVSTTNKTIDLGTIPVETIDCELWRIGAQLLADYHSVMLSSPPAGRLRIKRWENVIVGTPLTFYDYITVPTDFMTDTEYPTGSDRQRVLFHEFGHSIRHVADGSNSHWDYDNITYIYEQDHDYNTLHNKGFSFNEGWPNFWEQARSDSHRTIGLSCTTPGQRDWNEARVANRLLELRNRLNGSPMVLPLITRRPGQQDRILDSCMVATLFSRQIHSLRDFELQIVSLIPGLVVAPVNDCPEGFNDDGLTCRRDADSMAKPAAGCPCEYHDHGPTCFRNTLIFRDN